MKSRQSWSSVSLATREAGRTGDTETGWDEIAEADKVYREAVIGGTDWMG